MNSHDKIKKTIEEVAGSDVSFALTPTEEIAHGDYATNVAFICGKRENISPKEYAEKVKGVLLEKLSDCVSDIQIAGPGFINFFLKDEVRTKEALSFIDEGYFVKKPSGEVIVEYTDPNPFKLFHIGHLVPNAIGEAIARIYEAQGNKVTRICYQGDVGMHVAKTIFGIEILEKYSDKELPFRNNFFDVSTPVTTRINMLGTAYMTGNGSYEDSSVMWFSSLEEKRKHVTDLNKNIFDKSDQNLNKIYEYGKRISLEYFETVYKKLGTKFDHYIMESEVSEHGKEIVKKFLGTVFEESEGAIVYKGEKVGLHTRVFVNKEGLPTYEAKELGNTYKKKEFVPNATESIVVSGNEIDEYFKVIKAALSETDKPLSDSIKHISHGMLRLPEGKMSSRTGNVIPAEELIEKVKTHIVEKFKDTKKDGDLSDELLNNIAVASIKFAILKSAPGKDMVFDFEKSLSFEGDSGPYLQYTHAPLCTLLEKGKVITGVHSSYRGPVEQELEQTLSKYPFVLDKAYKELGPHHVVGYLLLLTRVFNSMYARVQIVDTIDQEKSAYYIALAQATKNVLNKGLHVLGIAAPERM